MNGREGTQESRLGSRDSAKLRYKEMLANPKDYDTLCLNQSELKHMHAIRPYCSKEQQRKSSRREHRHNQSPYQMSRSNSKRLDNSCRHSEERPKKISESQSAVTVSNNKQMSEMLGELINLKSEYKILKGNYSKIMNEKKEEVLHQQTLKKQLEEELDRRGKELERSQKSVGMLEQEIDRIRKECSRVLEMERFKMKKLEETLQEKELMIAYLRNEIDCLKRGIGEPVFNANQGLSFLQNSTPLINLSYMPRPNPNISALSSIPPDPARPSFPHEDDSLCLSRDKSKENDSIIHSFLSNDHSLQHNFRKDALIQSLEESPIVPQIEPIEEKSEHSEKETMDFKKGKEQSHDFIDLGLESKGKVKPNHKKLQILISDENSDTQNIPSQRLRDQLSLETKKKMSNQNNSLVLCKQKKKLTAKKVKPF